MTATELVTQALAEYEEAHGRPCHNAVIIAQKLNKRGRSSTTTETQEPKDAQLVSDEQELLSFVMANDSESNVAGKILRGARERIVRVKKNAPDRDRLDTIWYDYLARGIAGAAGTEEYLHSEDFGRDYHTVKTTTTEDTPSQAEQHLGRFIEANEVLAIWRDLK